MCCGHRVGVVGAMTQSQTPLIALKEVSYAYGAVRAVENVSGAFYPGSLMAVAGPNGAGKSTLLKILAGILKPQSGSLTFAPEVRGRIGYLPQNSALQRDYPVTVFQVAAAGLWSELGERGSLDAAARARVTRALDDVGLSGFETRRVAELSGGQFQRLLFARLLLQDPKVVLLDEPFAAVDAPTIGRLMQILLRWHGEGRTIICVLHDLMLIRKYFPESFLLHGQCLGCGHTHEMLESKLLSFDLDMAELVSPGDAHGKS